MPAILLALLPSVIPVLVGEAERLFGGGGNGPEKKAWVKQMLDELVGPLLGKLPAWAQPVAGELLPLVDALIEKGVAALKGQTS